MKIFRVKGSNPEKFCIAYVDPAQSGTKGYTMTTVQRPAKTKANPPSSDALL
jgi:hypothetical protein